MLTSVVLSLAALSVGAEAGQLPSNYEHLKCYELVVGTWTLKDKWFEDTPGAAKKGTPFTAQVSWKWILDKNVLEGDWFVEFDGSGKISGKGLTGWDCADKRIVLGGMDSSGGHGIGTVTYDESTKTWTQKEQIVDAQGNKNGQTIVFTYKDANTLLWQIKDRTGSTPASDSPVWTFKRTNP